MTTIYSNYDLFTEDMRAAAIESLIENYSEERTEEDISEEEITDEIYYIDEINWEDAKRELEDFFSDNKTYIIYGNVGRWDGSFRAGYIFTDFEDAFYKAIKDCDYWEFTDDNGHLLLKCSHHDGTNHFEIREVTERGTEYFDRWNYSWSDKRTEEYVHNQIINKYSRLPRFAEKVYGIKVKRGA